MERGLTAVLLCSYICCCAGKPKPTTEIQKNATEHIKCDVCKKAFTEAKRFSKERNINVKSKDDIDRLLKETCQYQKAAGMWMTALDIEETWILRGKEQPIPEGKRTLKLTERNKTGFCKKECIIIQKACRAMMDEVKLVQGINDKAPVKAKKATIDKTFAEGEGLDNELFAELLCLAKDFCKKKLEDLPHLKEWENEEFKSKIGKQILDDTVDHMLKIPGMEHLKKDDIKGDKILNLAAKMVAKQSEERLEKGEL